MVYHHLPNFTSTHIPIVYLCIRIFVRLSVSGLFFIYALSLLFFYSLLSCMPDCLFQYFVSSDEECAVRTQFIFNMYYKCSGSPTHTGWFLHSIELRFSRIFENGCSFFFDSVDWQVSFLFLYFVSLALHLTKINPAGIV